MRLRLMSDGMLSVHAKVDGEMHRRRAKTMQETPLIDMGDYPKIEAAGMGIIKSSLIYINSSEVTPRKSVNSAAT